jgi:hypothetical protein
MAGRPTDCTPTTTAAICEALKLGLSIRAACDSAGINQSSYFEWRSRADEGPPYSEFSEETTRARRAGRMSLVKTVRTAAQSDWRAATWMLERMDPDNFSRRTEVTGKEGGPIQVIVSPGLLADLPDDE